MGLNGSHVRVETRILNDRGVIVYLGAESHLTTAENDPNGLRVVVNGKTAQFTNDDDPCSLRTTVPGKLVCCVPPVLQVTGGGGGWPMTRESTRISS